MSDLDVDAIERRARAAFDWSVGTNTIPGPWDHDILALVSRIRELEAAAQRVRVFAAHLDQGGCMSCQSLSGGDSLARYIRTALDGSETS